MTDCGTCGKAVVRGARFCRMCGTPVAVPAAASRPGARGEPSCPSCQTTVTPGARFCRRCGHPLEEVTLPGSGDVAAEAEAGRGAAAAPTHAPATQAPAHRQETTPLATAAVVSSRCEICGNPVDGGGRACSACAALVGGSAPEPTQPLPAERFDVASDRGVPPPGQPVAASSHSRGRFYGLLAAVIILFACAGGAGAYFLVLAPADEDGGRDRGSGVAAAERGVAPGDSRLDRSGAPADPPDAGSETESEGSPGREMAQGEATDGADAPGAFDSGARERAAPSDDTPAPPPNGSPERTMYDHWVAIDERRYRDAYALFASSYDTDRAGWIADHRRPAPRIGGLELEAISKRGNRSRVQVTVVTRDTGKGELSCKRWSGEVLLVRERGAWRYAPRAPDRGPDRWFQVRRKGIGRSDPDCEETLRRG